MQIFEDYTLSTRKSLPIQTDSEHLNDVSSLPELALTHGCSSDRQDIACETPRVAILIPTFRRPDSLESLLRIIDEAVRLDRSALLDNWQLRIFIADNDAKGREGSQRAGELAGSLVVELEIIDEPKPGVSYVRNRLVDVALAWQPRYLLMIDDDEWPSRDWISHMLNTAERYSADVVSGPVRPDFEVTPPDWIVDNCLFDDAPLPTGEFPDVQRTGNTLLRSDQLVDHQRFHGKEWFSVELGRIGGEDSHLIEGLVKDGARHVWCEEAIVHERIPIQRLSLEYLGTRAFRSGNAGMRYRSMLMPGLRWSCVRVGKSLFLFMRWLVLTYRLFIPDLRPLHKLDWQVIRGRFNAHLGRFQQFY